MSKVETEVLLSESSSGGEESDGEETQEIQQQQPLQHHDQPQQHHDQQQQQKKQDEQTQDQQENLQKEQQHKQEQLVPQDEPQQHEAQQVDVQPQKICARCPNTNELLRCVACKSQYYCSRECQTLDWSSHKQSLTEVVVPRKTKSLDDFSQLTWVGQGNFSEIFWAVETSTGLRYAIKQINKRKLKQVNKELDVVMEKHCLSRLVDNAYAIRINSTFQDDDNLYFQMQYVDGGELWKQIHILGAVSQHLIKYYFGHVVKAIHSFHLMGIVHRDIKAENILLTRDDHKIVIIDFGTARDLQNPEVKGSGNGRKGKRNFEHFVGTPHFMAPECIRNKNSTYKSDVYSLGCLFYQIISGALPFEGKSEYLIFQQALESEVKFSPDCNFQAEQIELIRLMMTKDINDRIEMQDVMTHSYWGAEWDWENLPVYGGVEMTAMEKFLCAVKDSLFQVEGLEGNAAKQARMDEIKASKYAEIAELEDEENKSRYKCRLDYMLRQSVLFLCEEEEAPQPQLAQ